MIAEDPECTGHTVWLARKSNTANQFKKPLDSGKWLFRERLKAIMTLAQQLWLQVVVRPESQLRQW